MPTDPDRDRPRIYVAVPMKAGTAHHPPVSYTARREAEELLERLDVHLRLDVITEVYDPQAYDPTTARDACDALRARQLPTDAAWLIVAGTVR